MSTPSVLHHNIFYDTAYAFVLHSRIGMAYEAYGPYTVREKATGCCYTFNDPAIAVTDSTGWKEIGPDEIPKPLCRPIRAWLQGVRG